MENSVRVWDSFVRIFHWSLVAAFVISYVTAEDEGTHAVAGYVVSGLLVFRFIWGFIGTKHARFSDFVYGPREMIVYLRGLFSGNPKRYLGHNPAGGLMVMVLLITLSATCISGLKAYGEEGHGPLASENPLLVSMAYADDDDYNRNENEGEHREEDEFWEEVHEVFVNCTLILIAIHVSGVAVSSYLHKENLIMAMITGRKEARRG